MPGQAFGSPGIAEGKDLPALVQTWPAVLLALYLAVEGWCFDWRELRHPGATLAGRGIPEGEHNPMDEEEREESLWLTGCKELDPGSN